MARRKPAYWIIRCNDDSSVLDVKGRFMKMCASASDIKTYRSEGWMLKKLSQLSERFLKFRFTAYAVYDDDEVNCCGQIINAKGVR
jgi:hypothetical protein